MSEAKRILFVSQQIFPFLGEENAIRLRNRQLPEFFQSKGYETRTFMPKFGEINERRYQLHDVVRLSGINMIIADSDHPLILKVSSLPATHIQFYFVDNDDYFRRRKGVCDEQGVEYADNDERCIFFGRSIVETIKKLRWAPDIVVCSGWMSALVPVYWRKAYADVPFFVNSKIVYCLDNDEFTTPFGTTFGSKLLIDGVLSSDIKGVYGLPTAYEDLMRLAVDYSDAIVLASENVGARLLNYVENKGKPIIPNFEGNITEDFFNICQGLFNGDAK